MKRSTLINVISTAGLMGVLFAITPAGWTTDRSAQALTLIMIMPSAILSVALFVLAKIDQSLWSIISYITNAILLIFIVALVGAELS